MKSLLSPPSLAVCLALSQKIATNYRCKGMPLSSFLLKPMQRITRYPLLIKNASGKYSLCRLVTNTLLPPSFPPDLHRVHLQILEHTPDCHADRSPLREALQRAEELCSQVNEGVREKENSDRLEWTQGHVQCDGPIEVNAVGLFFSRRCTSNVLSPR